MTAHSPASARVLVVFERVHPNLVWTIRYGNPRNGGLESWLAHCKETQLPAAARTYLRQSLR